MMRCETCRFWREGAVWSQWEPFTDSQKHRLAEGTCRRHAPNARMVQPLTYRTDWCGEYVSKEADDAA